MGFKWIRRCLKKDPKPTADSGSSKRNDKLGLAGSSLHFALDGLSKSMEGVPAPGLQASMGAVLFIVESIKMAKENLEAFNELGDVLKSYTSFFENYRSKNAAKLPTALREAMSTLEEALRQIQGAISEVLAHCKVRRVIESKDDAQSLLQQFRRLDTALSRFGFETTFYIATKVKIVEEHYHESLLDKLPVEEGAYFDSSTRRPVACLPNTRIAVRDRVSQWLLSKGSTPLFWLRGRPGTGKSCIAQSIAEQYRDEGRLAGHFFFSRDILSQHSGLKFATTLASQLCDFDVRLIPYIAEKLQTDRSLKHASLAKQFAELVIDPLRQLESRSSAFCSPMLVVIDAIDECSEPETAKMILSLLLDIPISNRLERPIIRFLVTSRPDRHLVDALSAHSAAYELHDLDLEQSQEDIRHYLKHEFNSIRAAFPDCFKPQEIWPNPHIIESLAEQSCGLFIYASTILKFVADEDCNPISQLDVVLDQRTPDNPDIYGSLDRLYKDILLLAPKSSTRDVLSVILLGKRPFSPATLELFLGLRLGDVTIALRRLHSILLVPSDRNETIRLYHKSFYDFMTTESRSHQLYINPEEHHAKLALNCMRAITFQWPLCQDSPDHTPSVSVVQYALLFWPEHLDQSHEVDKETMAHAFGFIKTDLWLWFNGLMKFSLLDHLLPGLRYIRRLSLPHELSRFFLQEMDRLGVLLSSRHANLRYVDALLTAQGLHQHAVHHLEDIEPPCYSYLYHLAQSYRRQFEFHRRQYRDMLDRASYYINLALECVPPGHPDHPLLLAESAQCLCHARLKGLEKALSLYSEALEMLDDAHPNKPAIHYSRALASLVISTSSKRSALVDIDEAIEHTERALSLLPDGYSTLRSAYLNHLGTCLHTRFQRAQQPQDLQRAIEAATLASSDTLASSSLSFQATYNLAKYQTDKEPGTSLRAYLDALDAARRISWCALPVDMAAKQIDAVYECATDAAWEAVFSGQVEKAYRCVIQACDVWWIGRMNLRSPFLPSIVESPEVVELATQLDTGEREKWIYLPSDELPSAETLETRSALVQRYQKLFQGAGYSDSFASFNLPDGGRLVILNARSDLRCSGLILEKAGHRLRPLHLPIQPADLKACATQTQLLEHAKGDPKILLQNLWDGIVGPTVQALNLQPSNEPPRVWWCLTGLFSDLPLHAACNFTSSPHQFSTDYMVSSYLPTLARLPSSPAVELRTQYGFLDINSPKWNTRPKADLFAQMQNIIPAEKLCPIRNVTQPLSYVLEQLRHCAGAHIAAPVERRSDDPSFGRFILTEDVRISFQDLRDEERKPRFLYLTTFPDGDIPDITPCRVGYDLYNVGIASVVAQQCKISEAEATIMSTQFYKELKDLNFDMQAAATALHRAYIALRDSPANVKILARYIHIGL